MSETNFVKRNWKFAVGLVFTVFWSVVIGALHIVGAFYVFGVPFLGLLLGIVFIWLGKAKIITKIALTVMPVPLVLAASILVVQLNTAEAEVFLIPQHVRGEIVVFYDEPCGQETVYENGNRIYKLPENGILITKFKENSGDLNRKFYSVDADGNKTKIYEFHWQSFETEQENLQYFESTPAAELTKDSVGAFWAYGTETYQISRNSIGYKISNYRDFEISKQNQWNENKKFAQNSENLLNECRKTQ